MQEVVLGMMAAVGSMFFFGSFAVPMRTPAVLDAKIDPIIFQSYKSFACFATSWLVLIYTPLKFTWWGMLGALIWVITGSAAVLAVQLVGIGLAQSLWSSLSIIVSYIWGAYIFKEEIKNHTLSILSVFVMVIGMLGVGVVTGKGRIGTPGLIIQDRVCSVNSPEDLVSSLLVKDLNPTVEDAQVDASPVQKPNFLLMKGVGLATLVGVLNGSFMIPLKYAHKDVVGVEYLVSFGVGSMAMTILVLGTYWCSTKLFGHPFPSFEVKVGAGPALLTGLLWSSGNFLRFTVGAVTWCEDYGADQLELQSLAIRILSQVCSSSSIERLWSSFSNIHTKKRNRLGVQKANDLVFVNANLRLLTKMKTEYSRDV